MNSIRAQIVEVGPRDGLQAESGFIPTDAKVLLIKRLMDAGLRRIEATSFVSPVAVPQLADAADVLDRIPRPADVEISALVPNERGMERALAARVDRIAVFTSASETFAERNIRCSIDDSLGRFAPVVAAARAAGVPARGYVSMSWHCPYEGAINAGSAIAVALRLHELGCDEIVMADTVGKASPAEVRSLLEMLAAELPIEIVAVHLHDTSGQAVANVQAAVSAGVRVFDSAVGGLGGCPFAPGSPGNLSTDALVTTLERIGLTTGVDLDGLAWAAESIRAAVGRAG